MFQNEGEESEGKERKGARPGVVRCSYCVKQGNVVSAHTLVISECACQNKGKLCGNQNEWVCVLFLRERAGREDSSLWMIMPSVTTSLRW